LKNGKPESRTEEAMQDLIDTFLSGITEKFERELDLQLFLPALAKLLENRIYKFVENKIGHVPDCDLFEVSRRLHERVLEESKAKKNGSTKKAN
jgi:hypothetical protein